MSGSKRNRKSPTSWLGISSEGLGNGIGEVVLVAPGTGDWSGEIETEGSIGGGEAVAVTTGATGD